MRSGQSQNEQFGFEFAHVGDDLRLGRLSDGRGGDHTSVYVQLAHFECDLPRGSPKNTSGLSGGGHTQNEQFRAQFAQRGGDLHFGGLNINPGWRRGEVAPGGGPEPKRSPSGSKKGAQRPPKDGSNNGFNLWIRCFASGIASNISDPICWIHFWILVFWVWVRFLIPRNRIRPLWEVAGCEERSIPK